MTRRTVLRSPMFLAARRALNSLATEAAPAPSAEPDPAPRKIGEGHVLENANHILEFDRVTGRLHSLRAKDAPEQEFIVGSKRVPVFAIQYLSDAREFQVISSAEAKNVESESSGGTFRAVYTGLGGLDLSATVTVRLNESDPLSRWSISILNHANLNIIDVQFPFVVTPYQLGGTPGIESVLEPLTCGRFVQAPTPADFEPDSPHAWQFRPENFDTHHYPGLTFARFLAYYNDRAGIYLACQDDSGSIKNIKPVHSRDGGIRLGISHAGDWPSNGERELGYDVVIQTFQGDWYDAAGIYREWSLKQKWGSTPLHKRTDVPEWLLDSPAHIIVRIQGQVDDGPTEANEEFLPYPKLIPLLDKLSKKLNSPVVAIVMSWERPGSWIYPDSFPPTGGHESLREFSDMARARGWHVGSYCNGTRWVVQHFWSGYDGRLYYEDQRGAETICHKYDQQGWNEKWDPTWRPSFAGCLGVERTRKIAHDFVQKLMDDGIDSIQFLDQNAACSTFPCFATDHGHPAAPGKWMSTAMQSMLDDFKELAIETSQRSGGKRKLVFSVENAPNEFMMPNFQICDQRVAPPGHRDFGFLFFPLHAFLYHEFLLYQGGFGVAPIPYHLVLRNAYNFVMGEIPGGLLTGDGALLNRGDTDHWWSPWSSAVGSQDDAIDMVRTAIALRRGKGRPYVVYGRMLKPAKVDRIKIVHWESTAQVHDIPAVFHSAWQDPQGRFAVTQANWTNDSQLVTLWDQRLGSQVNEVISARESKTRQRRVDQGQVSVSLPPLSCVLIEAA